ncbi:Putative UDP-glucose flavonoid 3-O-glucosyltransferase 3 [Linum perenne]
MAVAEADQQLKLVFIPYPAVGHLASMVEFSKLIINRHSTLSVSFLIATSPATSASITNYTNSVSSSSDSSPRIKLIILPNLDDNPPSKFDPISIMDSQKPQLKQAVLAELAHSDPPRLAGLVLDMFCTSMLDVADDLGVPSFIYYTSTASTLGFFFHMQYLYDHHNYDILATTDSNDPEQLLNIPTYENPVPRKVFPLLDKDGWVMFRRMVRDFRKAKGILVNTVKELESHATESLLCGLIKNPKVYPVGPILNLNSDTWASSASHDVIGWLDQQHESSVVFLCFGSLGAFCGEQVKEIAHVLERSGERFVWSLRRPTGEGVQLSNPKDYDDFGEVLPEGFLDRTADVGRVIGWAPQTAVLAHKATGGFVSHCGTNSMLESLWFGVPMATWPMFADQQLCAFLLVKELGIATEISMGYQVMRVGEIVKADDIERGIRKLMDKDSLSKKKLKEFSDKTKEAIRDGGSSSSSIAEFLATL